MHARNAGCGFLLVLKFGLAGKFGFQLPLILCPGALFFVEQKKLALAANRWPARAPDRNLADLKAQIAACQAGASAVSDMIRTYGSDAVAGVVRLIEPTGRAHSVNIDVRPFTEGLHIRADEAEFQHTLINLLLNAVQASQAGDCVSIEVQAQAESVRIRIADKGCGKSKTQTGQLVITKETSPPSACPTPTTTSSTTSTSTSLP